MFELVSSFSVPSIVHGEEKDKAHDMLLKFTVKQGQYILTRPLHHSQEVISRDENHIIFKVHMKVTLDLIQELLSYGPSLQVLSPDCLINEIGKAISEMSKLYVSPASPLLPIP